jgi:hypothetical protein
LEKKEMKLLYFWYKYTDRKISFVDVRSFVNKYFPGIKTHFRKSSASDESVLCFYNADNMLGVEETFSYGTKEIPAIDIFDICWNIRSKS